VEQQANSAVFACRNCGMRSDLLYTDPRNDYLRQLRVGTPASSSAAAAASSSGGASSFGQSLTTPRKQFSKRDEEFERLAAEGDAYPRFAQTAALLPQDALRLVRGSFLATDYTAPSAALVRLIQSGKMTEVGAALPQPVSETHRDRDQLGSDATLLLRDGRITTANSLKIPPLGSLRDFFSALTSSILPSLFGQQAALADWLSLSRTIIAVESHHGWPAARKYLSDTLADCVNRRVPFAEYNPRTMDAVVRFANSHLIQASSRQAAIQPQPQQRAHSNFGQSNGSPPDARDNCCRDWNFERCNRSNCNLTHECMWLACTATDKRHPGSKCVNRPPPQPRRWPASSGAAPRDANSNGGGRRHH
jgi:hypothetical protein